MSLTVKRVMLGSDPFVSEVNVATWWYGDWPAHWIARTATPENDFHVTAFRLKFSLAKATTIRLHTTADERYELYVDGQMIGRGPERGDLNNWFVETRDVDFPAGDHVIIARTWWLGRIGGKAPFAQISVRNGFMLAAQGDGIEPKTLNTGHAAWEAKKLGGYEARVPYDAWGTGHKLRVVGKHVDWGFERGEGDGWTPAANTHIAKTGQSMDTIMPWLRPAVLPEQFSAPLAGMIARHVSAPATMDDLYKVQVRPVDNLPQEVSDWNNMLAGRGSVVIPANAKRRVMVDPGNYVCAYPVLKTTGGRDAAVRVFWTESLIEQLPKEKNESHHKHKNDRAAVDNKYFWGWPVGVGDEFVCDGGKSRSYSTLWWEAGRHVEVSIETAGEPLTIESFQLVETHYPYKFAATFTSSDERLEKVTPIALRTLEMCSHETYMDCPYFEQLQYIGDTRLEALVSYVTCADDRLAKKAVEIFDASRDQTGLTTSRYPCNSFQRIAPFSLWWVGMVHDHAMWRNDPAFVKARLGGVRTVLDAYASRVREDGLLGRMPGWNFVDWVPAWDCGMPAGAHDGVSGILNWHYALALLWSGALEEAFGEKEIAAMQRRRAVAIAKATIERFYNKSRGLMADDLDHKHFSEHAQCLAILSGLLPADISDRLMAGLLSATDLHRATIYFSHYLFEIFYKMGRTDRFLDRMPLWFEHLKLNLATTIEHPEPTRSDCHAWGAHPVFHYHASLLGVRPASFGFGSAVVRPQLGGLKWARGKTVHPHGMIETDFVAGASGVHGTVTLPAGVNGTFVDGERKVLLTSGANKV